LAKATESKRAAPAPTLATEVKYLKGAGPAVAQRLRALGIEQVRELLFHLPLRYEDRRRITPVAKLRDGEEAQVRARVLHAEVRYAGRRSLRVLVDDGEANLLLRFFHFNDTQRQAFQPDRWIQAYGPVRHGAQGWEMVHPEYRLADRPEDLRTEDRLTPIYPLTTGITQARLRTLAQQALKIAEGDPGLATPLPELGEVTTLAALRTLHQPPGDADTTALMGCTHPAQRRLVREELLAHQLSMRLLRNRVKAGAAPKIGGLAAAQEELQAGLPFSLTAAQQRVIGEIARDLDSARPMLRLVQGDVGSGKTLVAAAAMLTAVRAGWQAALMAPTELLAEQHARNFRQWLEPLGVEVQLLASKLKKSAKDAVLARIAGGGAGIVIGTHAVFQSAVSFHRLGLVVVDEQHRFGVQQRLALRDKGPGRLSPHQLIMSATPIPRTLAQTVYADLDVSIIDELPPGRSPVVTGAMSNEKRGEVLARIGEVCAQGRQAYWVCTLVEESEQVEAQAAEDTALQLRAELPGLRVGLVHGRLKSDEKDLQMRAFKEGQTQLLVATTVIEVGVDVPNASIMIIENAERLGLSQLHQLRGRVGRGAVESQCLLLYKPPLSEMARQRLAVMRETNDGFRVAQKDLELRGPGELFGRRQTGVIGMKLADPLRDAELVAPLQALADQWLQKQPGRAELLIGRWIGDVGKYAQV
jgi:ATP-dependent DNA helicase RecG